DRADRLAQHAPARRAGGRADRAVDHLAEPHPRRPPRRAAEGQDQPAPGYAVSVLAFDPVVLCVLYGVVDGWGRHSILAHYRAAPNARADLGGGVHSPD